MGSERALLTAALARALDVQIVRTDAARGGDSHLAMAATLADGRRVFVKHGADAATYAAEADGLAWLAEAGALATPAVLAIGPADAPFPRLRIGTSSSVAASRRCTASARRRSGSRVRT
jgi:hypothetical protein